MSLLHQIKKVFCCGTRNSRQSSISSRDSVSAQKPVQGTSTVAAPEPEVQQQNAAAAAAAVAPPPASQLELDSSHRLSPFDYIARRGHIGKMLYIPTTSDPKDIMQDLRSSLAQTISVLPMIAGRVVLDPDARQRGSLAVAGPPYTADDLLVSRDLRDVYDYADLRARGFPLGAVDGELVKPDVTRIPLAVIMAQVNFIRGGILFNIAYFHSVMDGNGLFNVMKLWSAFSRGEDGAKLVGPDWLDNKRLWEIDGVPGSASFLANLFDVDSVCDTKKDAIGASTGDSWGSPFGTSSLLFFSDRSLRTLKNEVMEALKQSSSQHETSEKNAKMSFISTNDALCALLWHRITAARQQASPHASAQSQSTFFMAVDCRTRLDPPVSSSYLGNTILGCKTVRRFSQLTDFSSAQLATSAHGIRSSLATVTSDFIKSVVKEVVLEEDVTDLNKRRFASLQRHVFNSNWSSQRYNDMVWGKGLGGAKCERLRFIPKHFDGVCVTLPHVEGDGEGESGFEVVVMLTHGPMERLREDETLKRFAGWVSG